MTEGPRKGEERCARCTHFKRDHDRRISGTTADSVLFHGQCRREYRCPNCYHVDTVCLCYAFVPEKGE
jgi:hypothetical protein